MSNLLRRQLLRWVLLWLLRLGQRGTGVAAAVLWLLLRRQLLWLCMLRLRLRAATFRTSTRLPSNRDCRACWQGRDEVQWLAELPDLIDFEQHQTARLQAGAQARRGLARNANLQCRWANPIVAG